LNNTRTRTGSNLLKTWMQRPLLSVKQIAARHDAVQLFARQDNSVQVGVVAGLLQGMSNISQVLARMKRGMSRVRDWKALLEVSLMSSDLERLPALIRLSGQFAARCAQMKDTTVELIGPTAQTMIKKVRR
jgi:DNA mismatch repair ATPase MutS